MSELMDGFWAAPPLARTVALSVFVTSLALFTGFLPGEWIYFQPHHLSMMPPQIWRLLTNFLVTTPKLGIILDPYFLYSYISQLETSNPKFGRKEDAAWYLIVVSSFILLPTSHDYVFGATILNSVFLGMPYCLQGLILSVAYTGTQDQRGQQASFFFLTIPAQLVPYAMLFVTLILMGPDYFFLQVIGLVAAHLHDFLTRLWPEFGGGRNMLPTPAFLTRLISTGRVEQRAYGTARFAAGSSGRSTGSSAGSGPLPDAWKTRGAGHRLG